MKGLIDFFVDRYRTTLTMMFLVLTWGMFSYSQIPNASEPDIDDSGTEAPESPGAPKGGEI